MSRSLLLLAGVLLALAPGLARADEPELPRDLTLHFVPAASLGAEALPDRAVTLPIDELLVLVERARTAREESEALAGTPPAPIVEARYSALVGQDVAFLEGELIIRGLVPGWLLADVRPGEGELTGLSVDGAPIPVRVAKGSGFVLPVAGGSSMTVALEMLVPVSTRGGLRTLRLSPPRGALTPLRLRLPEGLLLQDVDPSWCFSTQGSAGGLVLSGHLPPRQPLSLRLRPEAAGEGFPLTLTSRTRIAVSASSVRSAATLRLIGQGKKLEIALPPDATLLDVKVPLLVSTREERRESGRVLVVELERATEGAMLTLELEQPILDLPRDVEILLPSVPAAVRHGGLVELTVDGEILSRVISMSGLSFLGEERPQQRGGDARLFQLSGGPARLVLRLRRPDSLLRVDSALLAVLARGRAEFQARLDVSLTAGSLHELEVPLPDGWSVDAVTLTDNERAPRFVQDDRTLTLTFEPPLLPREQAHALHLAGDLGSVTLPRAIELTALLPSSAIAVVREIGVALEQGVTIVEKEVGAAVRAHPDHVASLFDDLPLPSRSWRLPAGEGSLFLEVLEEPTRISADISAVVLPSPSSYQTIADVRLRVERGATDHFAFETLPGVADHLQIVPLEPAGILIQSTWREDGVTHVILSAKVTDQALLRVTFPTPVPAAKRGALSDPVEILLRPLEVFSEESRFTVAAGEEMTVIPVTRGLVEIDPSLTYLPAFLATTPRMLHTFLLASRPASLALRSAVHEPAEVLACVVESATLELGLGHEGRMTSRLNLVVRHGDVQHLSLLLPRGSELWSTLADGEPVKTLTHDGRALLIPLPDGQERSSLTVVSALRGEAVPESGEIVVPLPRLSAPVLDARVILDLPGELRAEVIGGHLSIETEKRRHRPLLSRLFTRSLAGYGAADKAPTAQEGARDGRRGRAGFDLVPKPEEEAFLGEAALEKAKDADAFASRTEPGKAPTTLLDDVSPPARKAGILPVPIEIPRAGTTLSLRGHGLGGHLTLAVSPRQREKVREVLLFVAAVACGLVLRRRRWLPARAQALLLVPAFGIVPLLFPGLASPELDALLGGTLVVLATAFLTTLLRILRDATRLLLPEEVAERRTRLTALALLLLPLALSPGARGEEKILRAPDPSFPGASDIVIPFDPRSGLPPRGGTAFVSLDLFRLLWREAHPELSMSPVPPGFTEVVVAATRYEMEVGEHHVDVEIRADIFSYVEEAAPLTLGLSSLGLVSATIDGRSALVFRDDAGALRVSITGRGHHPLVLRGVIELTPGGSPEATLDVIPTSVSRIEVRAAPGRGAPRLHGLLQETTSDAQGHRLVAAGPREGRISLRIDARTPTPRATATTLDLGLLVEADAVEVRAILVVESAGERLRIRVPERLTVTAVSGEGFVASTWERPEGEDPILVLETSTGRRARVELYGLTSRAATIDVPFPRAEGSTLRSGKVVVGAARTIQPRPLVTDQLARQDTLRSTWPYPEHARQTHAFTIAGPEPSLRLALSEVESGHTARLSHMLDLPTVGSTLRVKAVLRARGLAPEIIALRIPEGFVPRLDEIRSSPVRVWMEDDLLFASAFAGGQQECTLAILLEGKTVNKRELPVLRAVDALSEDGDYLVRSDRSRRVSVTGVSARHDIDPAGLDALRDELLALLPGAPLALDQHAQRAITLEGALGAEISSEVLAPRTEAHVHTVAVVDEAWLSIRSTVTVRVEEGAVSSVLLRMPAEVAEHLELEGDSLAATTVASHEGDRVTIRADLHQPETRQIVLTARTLTGHRSSDRIRIHGIEPVASRTSGTVELRRELRDELDVVRTQGLVPSGKPLQWDWARKDRQPILLELRRQTVVTEKTLSAAIGNLSLATWVLDRYGASRGALLTMVELDLVNRSEPWLRLVLPPNVSLWSASVDGAPVKPVVPEEKPAVLERDLPWHRPFGKKRDAPRREARWIPLQKTAPGDLSSTIKLVLFEELPEPATACGAISVEAPHIEGIPVARTTWRFHLPEGRDLELEGDLSRIPEAVAQVDFLALLLEERRRLTKEAGEGPQEQMQRARVNLDRNFLLLQEQTAQARKSQVELESRIQNAAEEDEAQLFRNESSANRARLGQLVLELKQEAADLPVTGSESRSDLRARVAGRIPAAGREQAGRPQSPAPGQRADRALAEMDADTGPARAGSRATESLDYLLGKADEENILAGAGSAARAGLLSLSFELPPIHHTLVFKKLEGDARAVLRIEYDEPSASIGGVAILVLLLGLAAVVIRIRSLESPRR